MRIIGTTKDKEKKRREREAQEEPCMKKEKLGDSKVLFSTCFEKCTLLNMSRSTILVAIEGFGLISFP